MTELTLTQAMSKDVILCVDDEPAVLRLCTISVAQAGFRSAVAENGVAGLDAFIQLRDEIALVLSDIIMPVMNGIEMAESILRIEPQMKILMMSGYSDAVIELQGRNRFPFVRKPFIYAALIEKVQTIIGSAADSASAS